MFNVDNATIGRETYGDIRVLDHNLQYKLKIGNYCSIAPDVIFILGDDYRMDLTSSYPFKVQVLCSQEYEVLSKGDIIVGDDVWIGYGVAILLGMTIGQGSVVAAGAVVTKDVSSYTVVGGVPAKVIKRRFSEKIVDKMMKIDFSKLDENMIRHHIGDLYKTVDENMDLSWLPQKDTE